MNVLLLLAEEMKGHGVKGVGAELVVPHQDQQQVKEDPPLDVDRLVLPPSHLLGLQHRLLDLGARVADSAQERKVLDPEMLGPVDEVGQVKVLNVVAGDDIR